MVSLRYRNNFVLKFYQSTEIIILYQKRGLLFHLHNLTKIPHFEGHMSDGETILYHKTHTPNLFFSRIKDGILSSTEIQYLNRFMGHIKNPVSSAQLRCNLWSLQLVSFVNLRINLGYEFGIKFWKGTFSWMDSVYELITDGFMRQFEMFDIEPDMKYRLRCKASEWWRLT